MHKALLYYEWQNCDIEGFYAYMIVKLKQLCYYAYLRKGTPFMKTICQSTSFQIFQLSMH